jgi:uncharacterized RDD family membrane protein YckC
MENEQQHLLADLELNLVQARSGKRLANYLIDLVGFYVLLFCFGIVLALTDPSAREDVHSVSDLGSVVDRLIMLICYGIYMGLVEGLFKGKSLGKVITGTKAVNQDGSRISFMTGFLRGLARAVPFDAFSALGQPPFPWHDKWLNTYVIDERKSNFPVSE